MGCLKIHGSSLILDCAPGFISGHLLPLCTCHCLIYTDPSDMAPASQEKIKYQISDRLHVLTFPHLLQPVPWALIEWLQAFGLSLSLTAHLLTVFLQYDIQEEEPPLFLEGNLPIPGLLLHPVPLLSPNKRLEP